MEKENKNKVTAVIINQETQKPKDSQFSKNIASTLWNTKIESRLNWINKDNTWMYKYMRTSK